MSRSANEPPNDHGPAPGDRLDSWKEIAAYLRRSVRSAKRWENEEGLPVHRHRHGKLDSVYAYRGELDDWWTRRAVPASSDDTTDEPTSTLPDAEPASPSPEASEHELPQPQPARRTPRRAWLVAGGFGLAVLVAGVVAWLSGHEPPHAAGTRVRTLPPGSRDRVLVAQFENRTGEKLFDGTLAYALGLELSNSHRLSVVSRNRIQDTLRLMRKPADTPIDAAVARELCLRDEEIRALVTGRVEKVGEKYVLSGELVDPKADVTLAGFREESAGPDDSLAAIRRISDRIRTALGETPAPGESGWIPRVTTTKLRALQLFARADALVGSNDNPAAAEELLRQAVADDPKFASAWMHLAHALHNQGKPFAEVRACAEKAFQLSDTTSDRERYFIRGSYFFLMGEREKAIGAFEALRSLYPEHNWAIQILNNGLYDWKHDPRDLERAVEAEARWADANLTEFYPTFEAGFDFTVMKPDPARARPYLERARELLKTTEGYAELNPWLELLPSTQAWLKGDLETATAELNRVASTIDSRSGRMKDHFAASTALGYLTLGRLGAAEEAAGKITDSVTRNDLLAQIAFIKGDGRELRHRLQNRADSATRTDPPDWREPLAILEARTGLLPAARRFAAETERRRQEAVRNPRDDGGFHRMPEPLQHIVPGEIAFAEGNFAVAIGELEAAMRLENDWFRMQTGFYLGSESLAAALEKKGDIDGAIRALEQASDAKSQAVINQNWGAYWLRTRLELARAYRTAGRVEDARKVEADLQRLLAFADPGHPVLRELQKLPDSPSTATSGSSPTHPET